MLLLYFHASIMPFNEMYQLYYELRGNDNKKLLLSLSLYEKVPVPHRKAVSVEQQQQQQAGIS